MSETAMVSTRSPVVGKSVLFMLCQMARGASEEVLLGVEEGLGRVVRVDLQGNWTIEIAQGCVQCHGAQVRRSYELPALLSAWQGILPDYVAIVEAHGLVGLNDIARPTRPRKPQPGIGYSSQTSDSVIACPGCQRKLVAPSERTATVRCPKCLATWRPTPDTATRPLCAKDTLADQRLKQLNDTITDRLVSQDATIKNQPRVDQSYQAYLEFGADFNWD